VKLEVEGAPVALPFEEIDKAKLVLTDELIAAYQLAEEQQAEDQPLDEQPIDEQAH
jgi:hypothetical protein